MNCIKSQNQCINGVVFPGAMTRSTYDSETFSNGRFLKMLYIPFKSKICTNFSYLAAAPSYIPAILAVNKYNKANIFCIHFHGNACDIGQISMCAEREATAFNAHYLMIEYPRFGIANGHPNELVLNEVARIVHDFVIHELRVNYKNIVLMGRSIGTGPTCSLASYLESINMPVAAVILQSPYTSLVDVTSDLLGCASFFMLDRFPNWKRLVGTDKNVIQSPVLFIHADNDKVIDCNHSKIMHAERLKLGLRSELFIQASNERDIKGHNYFEYEKDMVAPSKEFLAKNLPQELFREVLALPAEVLALYVRIPEEYAVQAQEMQRTISPDGVPPDRNNSRDAKGRSDSNGLNGVSLINPAAGTSSSSSGGGSGRHVNTHCNDLNESKCTADVMCYWCLCPCTFTCECCVAMHANCALACFRFVTQTRPAFEYRRLKPNEATKGSLYNVLFRRASFAKKVNEHDAAAAAEATRHAVHTQHVRARSDSMKYRAGHHINQQSASEVNNPLQQKQQSTSGGNGHGAEADYHLPSGSVVRNAHGEIITGSSGSAGTALTTTSTADGSAASHHTHHGTRTVRSGSLSPVANADSAAIEYLVGSDNFIDAMNGITSDSSSAVGSPVEATNGGALTLPEEEKELDYVPG